MWFIPSNILQTAAITIALALAILCLISVYAISTIYVLFFQPIQFQICKDPEEIIRVLLVLLQVADNILRAVIDEIKLTPLDRCKQPAPCSQNCR